MADSPNRPVRKFNPGTFQSDAELAQQFVVRNHELGVILNVLRGNLRSPSCQHVLVVAPRGRGKTMLLARAAAELRANDEWSGRLLPVRFTEESPEIFTIADFWLETLFHLARECISHDAVLAGELHGSHAALSGDWRDENLEDRARAVILDAADRLGRRLVLMVENLQWLSKDVDDDFGWKLRAVLQTEPNVILLGSATSRFSGLDDAGQPFFEMFRIVDLKPLSTEECRRLWCAVSGDAVSGREIRPLEILTGGSPRLLVIVAGFARHQSVRRLMEELVVLIDEHTEYFRGHLEALGKSERRVYAAVLDLWQLSTAGEVASRARMDVRVVSTMLKRLIDRGAVVVEGAGKKRRYGAAERLYSIYYKLRRERDEAAVIENLIRFMAVFYSEAEQMKMWPAIVDEAAASAIIRGGLGRAAAVMPELQPLVALSETAAAERKFVQQRYRAIHEAYMQREYDSVIGMVERALVSLDAGSSDVSRAFTAWAMSMKGDAHERLDDPASAVASYEELVERFGAADDLKLRRVVVRAQIRKAETLEESTGLEPALPVYEDVVERIGASDDSDLMGWLGTALVNKGNTLAALGDVDAAAVAYDDVVQRFGDSDDMTWLSWVATALHAKGRAREEAGDSAGAIAAFGEVVERFGARESPVLRAFVVLALTQMIKLLTDAGNAASALRAYDEFESSLQRFGPVEAEQLQWQARRARTHVFSAEKNLPRLRDAFGMLYDVFVPWNEAMMRDVLDLVPDLIAAGAEAKDLVEILSRDESKAAALTPLVVALSQHAGGSVRAPDEVLEVAADIRERIKAKRPDRY